MSRAKVETAAGRGRWGWTALGLWWGALIWQLAPVWSASVEQAYGWGVPAFAAYFAVERSRRAPPAEKLGGGARVLAVVLLGAALVGLPVALTILEADPTWPTPQWAAFGLAAVATLAGIAIEGGAARARHFAFPVLFFSTALMWPTIVTNSAVAALVGMNARLAATVVSTFGHPAVVTGNVIEVSTGWVGVDEACSGLRSLLAVWMAGWFFGELFSFRWPRRGALVAGALAIAVMANWMRTTALTWIAAAATPAVAERWHDRIGGLELAGTLAAVAVLARWLGRRGRRQAVAREAVAPIGGAVARASAVGGLLALAVPAGWYGWHESSAAEVRVQWELVRPGAEWSDYEIPARARDLLRASSSTGYSRRQPDSSAREYALLLRWDRGNIEGLGAELHDPTLCLPAAGIAVEPERTAVTVSVDGVPVAFRAASFVAGGREQRVYYCHWDAWLARSRGAEGDLGPGRLRSWRLERAWLGRRHAAAAYLAFVVPADRDETGRQWLRAWAPRFLQRR